MIFSSILDTEAIMLYHHWLTIDEINQMSYLDFTLYVEKIMNIYEEDEKRKAEEKKQQYESMNTGFENIANMLNIASFGNN